MNQDKTIIKKILQDSLNDTEKESLHSGKPFSSLLEKQWAVAADTMFQNQTASDRIWTNISKELWDGSRAKRYLYYKAYSIAASILILFGIGGLSWMLTQAPPVITTMHITTSGIQNMESVVLPDGSIVQMGPGSKLIYPSEFVGKKREVQLEGQAFFDVIKDKSKPFVVKTKDMDVTALGTAFEIFSYNQENNVEAILLNGKIKVDIIQNNHQKQLILSPDEKLSLSRRDNEIKIEKVNASKYSDWRNHGILSFENEKLSMIIPRLEQWYGRKVLCQRDIADKYRFTFKVRDESLERILYMLNSSSPIKCKKIGENFELYLKK